MKIIVANQDNGTGRINTLFNAFEASAREVMPDAEIVQVKFPSFVEDRKNRALMINQAFIAAAKAAISFQEPVAVCDVDLMFLRSIEDAFDKSFELAVTVREKMRYNTGLWFYRPEAEPFVNHWIDASLEIFDRVHGPRPDPKMISKNQEFGGIDQTALAFVRESGAHDCNVLELPCQEWNATQTEWQAIDDKTRVVHIKSQLRNACFNKNLAVPPGCGTIVKRWREYAGI